MLTPEISKLRSMADSPKDPLVSIEWDQETPTAIYIQQEWNKSADPSTLLHEVHREVMASAPARSRYFPSLNDVRLDDVGEFATLIREAREERHRTPQEDEVIETRHFTSRWTGDRLTALTCSDPEWMLEATRMSIADELLHVCTPPPPPETGAAQRRLLRFVGRSAQ